VEAVVKKRGGKPMRKEILLTRVRIKVVILLKVASLPQILVLVTRLQ
jgi:hypothetical protein